LELKAFFSVKDSEDLIEVTVEVASDVYGFQAIFPLSGN